MFIRGLKAPCKDCTDRQAEPINCHSYCERYLNYVEQNKNNKKIIHDEKQKESDYYGVRHANTSFTKNSEKKYNY